MIRIVLVVIGIAFCIMSSFSAPANADEIQLSGMGYLGGFESPGLFQGIPTNTGPIFTGVSSAPQTFSGVMSTLHSAVVSSPRC